MVPSTIVAVSNVTKGMQNFTLTLNDVQEDMSGNFTLHTPASVLFQDKIRSYGIDLFVDMLGKGSPVTHTYPPW